MVTWVAIQKGKYGLLHNTLPLRSLQYKGTGLPCYFSLLGRVHCPSIGYRGNRIFVFLEWEFFFRLAEKNGIPENRIYAKVLFAEKYYKEKNLISQNYVFSLQPEKYIVYIKYIFPKLVIV